MRQFDQAALIIGNAIRTGGFRLDPSLISQMNRLATDGLVREPGEYRSRFVSIVGSSHQPPSPTRVAGLVSDMCEYINGRWSEPAVHLAAYALWRVGWIHPFDEGNGRTARAVAYVVLCARLGHMPTNRPSLPEIIAEQKQAYFDALEAADAAWQAGRRLDLQGLERLIQQFLTGRDEPEADSTI